MYIYDKYDARTLKTKSKSVCKFSGLGDVTKMFEYPNPTAAAMARPKAADLPRPLAAVNDTVDLETKQFWAIFKGRRF